MIFKIPAMEMVIGPIRRTVVTLSKNADRHAVTIINNIIIFQGLPFAILADLMAMYSNIPDALTTETNNIIPMRRPKVLKSIYDTAFSTVNM